MMKATRESISTIQNDGIRLVEGLVTK